MTDPIRRALRSLVQVGIVTICIQMWNAFAPHPLDNAQALALTALGTMLTSFVQNAAEEAGAIPSLLKGPAEPVVVVNPSEMVEAHEVTQQEIRALAEYLRDFRADVTSEIHDLKTRPNVGVTGGPAISSWLPGGTRPLPDIST